MYHKNTHKQLKKIKTQINKLIYYFMMPMGWFIKIFQNVILKMKYINLFVKKFINKTLNYNQKKYILF